MLYVTTTLDNSRKLLYGDGGSRTTSFLKYLYISIYKAFEYFSKFAKCQIKCHYNKISVVGGKH